MVSHILKAIQNLQVRRYLLLQNQKEALGGLFMKLFAHVTDGRNGEESVATPISFSLFNYVDMKSL